MKAMNLPGISILSGIAVTSLAALSILPLRAAFVEASKTPRQERKIEDLGDLKKDLDLWLAMDTTEKGGVTWSKRPVKVVASSEVQIKAEDGQRWMDFNEAGALLKFEPVLEIGTEYTLCTWILLPSSHSHSMVWQGTNEGGARFSWEKSGSPDGAASAMHR